MKTKVRSHQTSTRLRFVDLGFTRVCSGATRTTPMGSSTTARRSPERVKPNTRLPKPHGITRIATFCLFASFISVNGQNVASTDGTFVDVTSNVQTQLDGRFGTVPSHRSGHTMVRAEKLGNLIDQTRAPQRPIEELFRERRDGTERTRSCFEWKKTVFCQSQTLSIQR
jgi:hypothetical protein